MKRQKSALASRTKKTIHTALYKLFPLIALSAIVTTAAHAEDVVINDCPEARVIHEKYVKDGAFTPQAEGESWVLSSTAMPTNYDLSRIALYSIEATEDPKTDALKSFSCLYNNDKKTAPPIKLSFEVGRGKLTFNEGYSFSTGSAPYLYNNESDGTHYWKSLGKNSNVRVCDTDNKKEDGFKSRCGGFTITHKVQPNGYWQNAGAACKMNYELCKDNPNEDSYVHKINKKISADTHYKVCKTWGGWFMTSCLTWSMEYKRQPHCKTARCTEEIAAMNAVVEGTTNDNNRQTQGMARYLNMCWAGKSWANKLWNNDHGSNCDVKEAPASWPDYNGIPENTK